ncbi:hypothetical protein EDB81DRAFT_886907 [Dactylonectria macrodidyma]|uniref:Uncharacterized protein n=1 Tax=Dactylonectria macrodidyma TaxID=307937 RepID=A0A9P9EBG9_9HYPO|nr:hypothetical protein EDB81DRAFT_886907 [Dactylonectria macrodidyma]
MASEDIVAAYLAISPGIALTGSVARPLPVGLPGPPPLLGMWRNSLPEGRAKTAVVLHVDTEGNFHNEVAEEAKEKAKDKPADKAPEEDKAEKATEKEGEGVETSAGVTAVPDVDMARSLLSKHPISTKEASKPHPQASHTY